MKDDLCVMLTDEALLVSRTEDEAKEGTYTIVNWPDDSGYIRTATFEEVIKYTISDMDGYDKDELESAQAIRGFMQEQDGSSKILQIFTYDANRQRMSGYRKLDDRVGGYIFARRLHDDDKRDDQADFLEMAVRLESPVGNGWR